MNGLRNAIGTYGVHELKLFPVSLNTPLILGIGRGPHLTPLGKKGYSYKTNSPNKIAMKSGEIN